MSDKSAGNASWLPITGGDTLFPASHASALRLHVVDHNVALGDLVPLPASKPKPGWRLDDEGRTE